MRQTPTFDQLFGLSHSQIFVASTIGRLINLRRNENHREFRFIAARGTKICVRQRRSVRITGRQLLVSRSTLKIFKLTFDDSAGYRYNRQTLSVYDLLLWA